MMLRSFIGFSLFVLIVTSTQCFAQSTTNNPFTVPYRDCCELKLMDSNLQVAIDSSRTLPVGQYVSLRARFCTTDAIYIQIWKQINNTSYEFKWQTQYTATQADTVKAYSVVRFDNNPVTIEATDRIGVYNPSTNTNLKFSIPYDFDTPPSSAMYFSSQRFDSASAFTTGLVIFMEDLRWPRTLAAFLSFCQSVADCQELSSDIPATTMNPYTGYIPKSCCNKMVACDAGNSVKDGLTNQNNQVKNLQDTINNLEITLQNLLNSQYITGTCPDGFVAGTYGIGSCYIAQREQLQMAQAVIRCRDLYSARLLNIQSEQEDRFVRSFLMNTTTSAAVERFWTSGMYNFELRNWFWYDDDLLTKVAFGAYRNWKDGLELAATSVYDVCSVFTVDEVQNIDYWEKTVCTNLNYYVCEVPKMCF